MAKVTIPAVNTRFIDLISNDELKRIRSADDNSNHYQVYFQNVGNTNIHFEFGKGSIASVTDSCYIPANPLDGGAPYDLSYNEVSLEDLYLISDGGDNTDFRYAINGQF